MSSRLATFGEFGVALVGEVFTAQFVRRQLDLALQTLKDGEPTAELAADIANARVHTLTLVADDGYERSFAVTVRAQLNARLGPRLWALGIAATVEIDLTVHLRTFYPTTAQLDIGSVSSTDLRLRARARSDWLPLPLFDGGGATWLLSTAERSLSIFSATLNRILEASASQRQLDVLEYLRRIHAQWVSSRGSLAPAAAEPESRLDPPPRAEHPVAVDAGDRIGFAEFAEELLRRGLDAPTIHDSISPHLPREARFEVDAPIRARGRATAELSAVTPEPKCADELRFRCTLDSGLELLVRPDVKDTEVTATLRVQVVLRFSTLINPAALLMGFDPVSAHDVEIVSVRRRIRGRWIPIPTRALTRLLRGRIAEELNSRLTQASRRIVVAELAHRPAGASALVEQALRAHG